MVLTVDVDSILGKFSLSGSYSHDLGTAGLNILLRVPSHIYF